VRSETRPRVEMSSGFGGGGTLAYLLYNRMAKSLSAEKEKIKGSIRLTESERKWRDSLKIGDLLDARDRHGTWHISMVSEVEKKRIQVLYMECGLNAWYQKYSLDIARRGNGPKFERVVSKAAQQSLGKRASDKFGYMISKESALQKAEILQLEGYKFPTPSLEEPESEPLPLEGAKKSGDGKKKSDGKKRDVIAGEENISSKKTNVVNVVDAKTGDTPEKENIPIRDEKEKDWEWFDKLEREDILDVYCYGMWTVGCVQKKTTESILVSHIQNPQILDKVYKKGDATIAKYGSEVFKAPEQQTRPQARRSLDLNGINTHSLMQKLLPTATDEKKEEKEMKANERKWRHSLTKGDFLDAVDQDGLWYHAEIKSIDYKTEGKTHADDRLYIKFIEWMETWNMYRYRYSINLSPFDSKALSRNKQDVANDRIDRTEEIYSKVDTARKSCCISKKSIPAKVSNSNGGRIIRYRMPKDNSCLFHCFTYCCEDRGPRDWDHAKVQRKRVSDFVDKDPKFCKATGYHREDYCKKILKAFNWGGAVEIMILSKFFDVEVVAFDLDGPVAYQFSPLDEPESQAPSKIEDSEKKDGKKKEKSISQKTETKTPKEKKKNLIKEQKSDSKKRDPPTKRIFLVYSGYHYDALVFLNNESTTMQEFFDVNDEQVRCIFLLVFVST